MEDTVEYLLLTVRWQTRTTKLCQIARFRMYLAREVQNEASDLHPMCQIHAKPAWLDRFLLFSFVTSIGM